MKLPGVVGRSANRIIFALALLAVCSGIVSAPLALALGLTFGLTVLHPYPRESRLWSRRLLQISVVALGFGMNFAQVLRASRAGFGYSAIGIAASMTIGLLLGRWFGVQSKAAFLITAGTAICGGSAIAAIAPITEPSEEELAMSMGTVFTLNSLALFLFPPIGWALHLSQTQFGLWSALAIHDTSSVVGATAHFGQRALAVGTVVKLTRALWIVPVAFLTAWGTKAKSGAKSRIKIPWFIAAFCGAALANTYLPAAADWFHRGASAGRIGMAITLFLIGSGISVKTLRQAGGAVMAQGVVLWLLVASFSLEAISLGWIAL